MSTEPLDSLAIARRLAAAYPAATLPCPICAASLNAENLDKHLAKVHPGAAAPTGPWRGKGALGLFPCSVRFDGDVIVLRHTLGLFRRELPLSCSIESGSLWSSRPDAIGVQYDINTTVDVRAGRYLRFVDPRSRLAITIACRQSTQFTAHWARSGWTDGGKRRAKDLVVAREAMLAIEYELARRGLLVPAP
ncbi:MAG: hypothetical protein H0V17_21990 [Deltaproteobacteria bacterium]|nr:hypothetical protein [Deltaproteobacteria bacterium]